MRYSTSVLFALAAGLGSVLAQVTPSSSSLQPRALATVYKSCTVNKTIALTFDDGPYIFETDLQTLLTKNNASATFFVNGKNWACAYDDARIKALRSLYSAKFEFASHTWSHANLSTLTWDGIHSEMWKTEQLLTRVLGVNPAMMRPPYGAYNDLVLQAAKNRNQSVIMWDFDSGDTTGSTAAQSNAAYDALLAKKPLNALPLNHEVINGTVTTVIPHVLSTWKAKGYKFVTVSECLGIKPYQGTPVAQSVKDSTWKC